MQNILIVGDILGVSYASGLYKVYVDGFSFYFREFGGDVPRDCLDKVILTKKPSTGSDEKWIENVMQTKLEEDSELLDWSE